MKSLQLFIVLFFVLSLSVAGGASLESEFLTPDSALTEQ